MPASKYRNRVRIDKLSFDTSSGEAVRTHTPLCEAFAYVSARSSGGIGSPQTTGVLATQVRYTVAIRWTPYTAQIANGDIIVMADGRVLEVIGSPLNTDERNMELLIDALQVDPTGLT